MSKSKLGMGTFDIDKRFESKEEAFKYAKRLREFIRYNCKKRNWAAEAIICISNIKGSSSNIYLEQNGKVGRPKKKRINYDNIERNVDWHIHVLLVSKPSYSFRKIIKDYLDKNWFGGRKKEFIYDNNKKVYKKNCNINKVEYYIAQSDEILFCNYNCDNLIPKGYSLKDLYYAYLKKNSSNKYVLKYLDNYDEKLAIEDNYYKIKDYYWNLTSKQNKKENEEYMKEAQVRKIAENYERLDLLNNNVQKNINRMEDMSSIF